MFHYLYPPVTSKYCPLQLIIRHPQSMIFPWGKTLSVWNKANKPITVLEPWSAFSVSATDPLYLEQEWLPYR